MQRSPYFKLRSDIKNEWLDLWRTKHDDKKKFESASSKYFPILDVDQGQIIRSSKASESLDFFDVIENSFGKDETSKIFPDPSIGGWNKFAKTYFKKKKVIERERPKIKLDLNQPQRKNGAGWLNQMRIRRKVRHNEY